MNWETLTRHVEERLLAPLPGPEAQYRMAHVHRQAARQVPTDARNAGVMLLLYPGEEEAHTVLIRRQNLRAEDRHKGQIGLPGGKEEPADPSLAHSAIRETEEEVGVPREQIRLVRALTPLYIPVSNYLVHPYVGLAVERPTFVAQPEEVAEILEVPLAHLTDPAIRRQKDLRIDPHITLKRVPYFAVANEVVWGATAMILSEFLAWWHPEQARPESLSL